MDSDCAVEWFLPFHSFFDTQCSAVVFKSLIQFALIVIHIANVVELISFLNCIFLFLVFDYRKWFMVRLFPNFCRWSIHFFCPYLQDINYRLSDHSCKIKMFGWPIGFVNAYQSLIVFQQVHWGSTLPLCSIYVIKNSSITDWVKLIRMSKKTKLISIRVDISSDCQCYFIL